MTDKPITSDDVIQTAKRCSREIEAADAKRLDKIKYDLSHINMFDEGHYEDFVRRNMVWLLEQVEKLNRQKDRLLRQIQETELERGHSKEVGRACVDSLEEGDHWISCAWVLDVFNVSWTDAYHKGQEALKKQTKAADEEEMGSGFDKCI